MVTGDVVVVGGGEVVVDGGGVVAVGSVVVVVGGGEVVVEGGAVVVEGSVVAVVVSDPVTVVVGGGTVGDGPFVVAEAASRGGRGLGMVVVGSCVVVATGVAAGSARVAGAARSRRSSPSAVALSAVDGSVGAGAGPDCSAARCETPIATASPTYDTAPVRPTARRTRRAGCGRRCRGTPSDRHARPPG